MKKSSEIELFPEMKSGTRISAIQVVFELHLRDSVMGVFKGVFKGEISPLHPNSFLASLEPLNSSRNEKYN